MATLSRLLRAGVSCGLLALAGHAAAAQSGDAAAPSELLQSSHQLMLVVTRDWDATDGRMQLFQRSAAGGAWVAVGKADPIAVGRTGLAWGVGLHASQSAGPQKKEGDGKAPAGVFTLGQAFGYAATVTTGLHYAPMSATNYCIDVPGSPLYNQIVDSRDVGEAAVKESTEPMRRDLHAQGDQRYKEGFVIQHNAANVSGAGSCIFAHLWKAPGEPTAGCTAMAEPTMDHLLAWLDARRQPLLVQLPQAEYERLRASWKLPALDGATP
jgi:L,D-peptidoglycan transpeptidase YkuD (ErfK/YbiS/YcfS/YnhG family)